MNELIKTYAVKVIRESGNDPLTGEITAPAEQELEIDATSTQAAHRIAQMMTTLKFRGQMMRVFIDGTEHLDERI